MPVDDILLALDGISYHIGNNQILNNISLVINKQDTISLIGPNGAGKSTLVKLILG